MLSVETPTTYYTATRKHALKFDDPEQGLGASIIQSRIQRYQIDADFCHGYGYLGLNKRQGRLLHTWEKEYKQLNPEHEIAYLEGAEVRSIVGSDVYSCALKHVVSCVIADGMTSGSRHWDVMSAIPRTRIPGKDHWRNLICTLGKASHQLAGYRNGRALGTWFQGEVAANYAGPFNSNADVQHLGLKFAVADDLKLGMLLYAFRTLDTSRSQLDADEADIYAEWAIDQHWTLMPLVGLYKSKQSSASGGTQVGNSRTNLYGQVLVAWAF
ncbi:hypothetical protein BSG18_18920 [Pseudomonas ogarae]|nr:hypothetical protein [Pseudomonas ogarae]PBJ09972.1 hypothetical protein BSF43_28320 [Pseudomonas ogarae]PBJ23869.1 hypothetical protein BSG18_18920 [Pseudomonas ogarae]